VAPHFRPWTIYRERAMRTASLQGDPDTITRRIELAKQLALLLCDHRIHSPVHTVTRCNRPAK